MSKCKNRKSFLFMLVLCLLFAVVGCNSKTSRNPNEIWIVTEETTKDGMNGQAENIIRAFEEEHEGITIKLEVLPKDRQERETRLEKLRAAIMSGKGPDGFLLPCDTKSNMPLFYDINQAMRSGLFLDIGAYYDADEELDKDGLLDIVMAAGVIDDARYILPLRYDFPVIYADAELLNTSGLDIDRLSSGVNEFMSEISRNGNDPWMQGSYLTKSHTLGYFAYFSQIIDYETGEVVVDKEALKNYLTSYQNISALRGESYPQWVGNLVSYLGLPEFFNESHPIEISTLSSAYEYAAISKRIGQEVAMIPLRSMEGDVVATITYFAAVGAGSNNPEMTYNFLREFLTEKSQWEQNRVTTSRYTTGLVADGWPVRSSGAVEPLWHVCWKIHREPGEEAPLLGVELSDKDVPILEVAIDKVRFCNGYMEYQIMGSKFGLLNNASTGEATNTDISQLVDEIIEDMEHHLAEG